jgi:ABC-2 type transport system permease protein
VTTTATRTPTPAPDVVRPRPRRFAETGALLSHLVLRRDRVRIAMWFLAIVGLTTVSAASVVGLYDTGIELEQYARLVRDNAALIVQAGPGYGLDDPTVGAVLMNELSIWAIVSVGLMSVFLVVRHTRAEEESERAELVRAAPVGRDAQLAAALAGVTIANAVVATGVVIGLLAYGLPGVGSVAFGLALFGAGSVFASATAVAAQVASGGRAALALGGATIAVSFVMRAVGDVGAGWLSWLSPIGWGQATRAFADERWWVLALPFASSAALVWLAVILAERRDLGAGLLGQRPGPAAGAPGLSTPAALARRIQRGALLGWTVGVALLGFFYGVVADQAEQMLEDNPDLADFFAQLGQGSVTEAFLATAMLMMALIASGFTVSSVLRLRSEETAARADPVLATPVSRRRWLGSHVVVAFGGTVIVMAVTGLAMGVGFAATTGDPTDVVPVVGAALVMVPAMLVLAGVAVALFGAVPRWSLLAWAALVFATVVGLLADVLDLPSWLRDLSPFHHVPALPAAPFDAVPIVLLLVVGSALTAAGAWSFDRRDVG